jgi:hypothetical protein
MPSKRTIRGTLRVHDNPVWEPLLTLVGRHGVVWFMWMGEVELADGSVLHIYKHSATRRSLHLCTDDRAFVFVGDHSYREADPHEMVDLVIGGWRPDDDEWIP